MALVRQEWTSLSRFPSAFGEYSDPGPYPSAEIPEDRRHEFFGQPLRSDDPDLASWVLHFKEKRVRVKVVPGPWGTQIYLHRVTHTNSGAKAQRWCCKEENRVGETSAFAEHAAGGGQRHRHHVGPGPRMPTLALGDERVAPSRSPYRLGRPHQGAE